MLWTQRLCALFPNRRQAVQLLIREPGVLGFQSWLLPGLGCGISLLLTAGCVLIIPRFSSEKLSPESSAARNQSRCPPEGRAPGAGEIGNVGEKAAEVGDARAEAAGRLHHSESRKHP